MNAGCNFLLGALDLGLEFIGDFQLIFDQVIELVANRLHVLDGQPGDGGFNFLHGAHCR